MADRKRIGIVFALELERRELDRALIRARVTRRIDGGLIWWSAGAVEILAAVSGIGGSRSTEATEALLKEEPELVISAGLAAGLDSDLKVGDVIVAKRVLGQRPDADEPIHCEAFLPPPAPTGRSYRVRHGDLASADRVVRTGIEKSRIRELTGAIALDMESHAAGLACRRHGVPFAAVRSISDTAQDELPEFFEAAARADGPWHLPILAARRPRDWRILARILRQAQSAAQSLGDFLGFALVRTAPAEQARP